jgi:hypothetical protein
VRAAPLSAAIVRVVRVKDPPYVDECTVNLMSGVHQLPQ